MSLAHPADRNVVAVQAIDVLILTTPATMTNDQKSKYLDWFRGTLVGTSLETCKVILLDGGADVRLYRGEAAAVT